MFKTTKKFKTEITRVSDVSEKFGKYQILQYFYASLPAIFVSMINVNYIFVAGEVGYKCRIRECESSNISNTYSVPWWENHTDQCMRPILNQTYIDNGVCTNNSFTGALEQCTDWVYENHNTIISKFNLACQPWKRTMVGTIHNVGMTMAELWAGWMADMQIIYLVIVDRGVHQLPFDDLLIRVYSYGRKIIMIICALGCLIGNFKTIVPSYPLYISLEFLEALICGGIYTVGGVLMLEIAPNKNRVFAGVLFSYAIYFGEAVFAVVGLIVPNWKSLIYIICSPPILFIFYFILVNESLRWLILKGKTNQAKEILRKMIQLNNINANMEEYNALDDKKLKAMLNLGPTESKEGIKQVFQCRRLFTWFLIISFSRFTVGFVYYGLLVNSVVLPGDTHINFLLAACMSFPGELLSLFLMNKIGRRLPLIYGFLLFGIAYIASSYVPESYVWLKIFLFLFSKFVVSACYTGIATYAMELFPTSVRGLLIGLCTVASSLGNMLAPLSPLLSPVVASILFGCLAITSSFLLYFTPETKDLNLIDTIEQVADSIKVAKSKKESDGRKNVVNKGKLVDNIV